MIYLSNSKTDQTAIEIKCSKDSETTVEIEVEFQEMMIDFILATNRNRDNKNISQSDLPSAYTEVIMDWKNLC